MDVESGSDSDWLNEEEALKIRNQKRERIRTSMNSKRNSFPPYTSHQKRFTRVGKSIKRKLEFPVTCGDKKGILHKAEYKKGKPCIISEGQWFTPNDFEKFGGKERYKKWKISILYEQIPLQTFIQEGFLSSSSFKTRRPQDQQPECTKVMSTRANSTSYRSDSPTWESLDEAAFSSKCFNVRCDRGEGVLHVDRFATETCGKCIRTQDAWLSPKEFLEHNKAGGNWKRDIISRDVPLGMLIMRRLLTPHMINCKCPICKQEIPHLLDQKNDDVCFICKWGGALVCCDECPRAFHHHCHTPALNDDTSGNHWTCSFCTM